MSYQVPQHIDKNKIFIVKRSEIEGRLDPSIYKDSFTFISKIYTNISLKEIAYINPNTSFSRLREDDEVSFIPMEFVNPIDGIVSKLGKKKVKESKGFTKFLENDLLWAKITPCMQNGNSAIARNLINSCGCGSTEFFVIRPKTKNIMVEYIHYILHSEKIRQTAQNYFGGSAGQQRVPVAFLQNLSIPLPPISVQKKLVKIITDAKNNKIKKEAEAQKLLDSIDGYILSELGITMPKIDCCNNRKIFTLNKSELSNRYDPYYFQDYFKISFEEINKCSYPIKTIKELSCLITSGITPKSGGDAYTEDQTNGIPFIRSGNIDINGKLDFADLLYLRPQIHNTTMKSSQVKKEDLLIAIVGATIGQVGIYLDEREANINQAIALVRLKRGINVQYVKELIKSSIGQLSLNRLKRPVARANINLEEISTIKIPLPPLAKQQEIADHITALRHQAAQLQQEGKEALEKAKQEVEQMILGK